MKDWNGINPIDDEYPFGVLNSLQTNSNPGNPNGNNDSQLSWNEIQQW